MGLEAIIEADARRYMLARGGVLLKWVSPGCRGVPDRIASHAKSGPFFLEFKAPGKKLTPEQRSTCTGLAEKGCRVYANVASIMMAREVIDDEIAGRPGARHPYL